MPAVNNHSFLGIKPWPRNHQADVRMIKIMYAAAFALSALVVLAGVYGILGSVGVIPADLNLMAYLGQFLTSNQLLASSIGVTSLGVLMTGITYAVVKGIGWPHHTDRIMGN